MSERAESKPAVRSLVTSVGKCANTAVYTGWLPDRRDRTVGVPHMTIRARGERPYLLLR